MMLVFAHGEKGGVGKSVMAAGVLDYLVAEKKTPVTLIEGDVGTPDVAWRFQDVDGVQMIPIPLNRAGAATEAVMDFMSKIEDQVRTDIAVVNLPAAAGETLDPLASEVLGPVADELGIRINVAYMIGSTPSSVEHAQSSAENGLVSISDQVVAIMNEKTGRTGSFAWIRSDVRQRWLQAGAIELQLPDLAERVAAVVRKTPAPYSALAAGETGGLRAVERSVLRKWLRTVHEIAAAVLGEDRETGR